MKWVKLMNFAIHVQNISVGKRAVDIAVDDSILKHIVTDCCPLSISVKRIEAKVQIEVKCKCMCGETFEIRLTEFISLEIDLP